MSEIFGVDFVGEGTTAEVLAASRSGAVLFDVSTLTRVELTGKDRAKIIANLCTADVGKLAEGKGTEAFFLNAKGKIQEYARVFAGAERHVIELEEGRGAGLVAHLDRFVFREDVRIAERTAEEKQLHLAGPGAKERLLELFPALTGEGKELGYEDFEWNGVMVQVRSRARSVEGGFDLVLANAAAAKFVSGLRAKGVMLGGADALEALRVEASLPMWGREVTEENLAQEIGRDTQAISFTKGCYLGQETVARLDALGHVNKLLRGLEFAAGVAVPTGAAVTSAGKVIGKVTSSTRESRYGKGIGLGVLRVQGGEPGSAVEIETASGAVVAKVVALPFVESL